MTHGATKLWGHGGLLFDFWHAESTSGFFFRTNLERTDVNASPEWSSNLRQWSRDGLEVVEQGREGSRATWKVTLPGARSVIFFRMRTALEE